MGFSDELYYNIDVNKSLFLIPVVLIIGVGGVAFFILQSRPEISVEDQVTSITPTAQVTQPAIEVEVEETEILPVGNYTGEGIATRIFDGTQFTHSVKANLPDPAEGKFYEGWLVIKTPSLRFFSTGKMVKDNGQYVLSYQTGKNQSEYNEVVITKETESLGLDNNPETHVLEGSF